MVNQHLYRKVDQLGVPLYRVGKLTSHFRRRYLRQVSDLLVLSYFPVI